MDEGALAGLRGQGFVDPANGTGSGNEKRRRDFVPDAFLTAVAKSLCMRTAFMLALVGICAGCGRPPPGLQTAAIIEVQLQGPTDRAELVEILRRHAKADSGLHVDDASATWRKLHNPLTGALNHAGVLRIFVWRGADDDFPEADASDLLHPGLAVVTFVRGENPRLSAGYRSAVLADIKRRWPGANLVPVEGRERPRHRLER